MVDGYKIVVFDEAQSVKNIGRLLKMLYDHKKDIQYIAIGSSSFDLANEVSEPLTGRSLKFTLYPISLSERVDNDFDAEGALPDLMRFGGYPDIINLSEDEKILRLKTLTTQYLYKNVLAIGGIRKLELITRLLGLLSLQIGQEVSYRELAEQLQTSVITIKRYIDLLEKSFIVFRLGSFAKNLRNELARSKKIYFTDLGVRNTIIGAFSPIDNTLRNDIGALFENCMTQAFKTLAFSCYVHCTTCSG